MSVNVWPTFEDFETLGAGHRVVSVWTKVPAADRNACDLYAQLCDQRPGTFLLESAEQGVWSRYSFVGVRSDAALVGRGDHCTWTGRPIAGLPGDGRPLDVLAASLAALQTPRDRELPPFTSGLVGYLGYDLVGQLEFIGQPNPDELGVPDLVMLLVSELAVLDHQEGEIWLIANAINFDGSPERIELAYADAKARVVAMATELQGNSVDHPTNSLAGRTLGQVQRRSSAEDFHQMVGRAKQHIVAGDAFQIVASQRFSVETNLDALDIYRELRVLNPSPYLYLLRLADEHGSFDVVGSSPEALVTVKDGLATTHPIAGTRPRGETQAADELLERELLADEKERAEHLMLVDLGRNDLGRVCEPGSVVVTEFMNVHRYSTVMHLEATVQGRPRPEQSALDVTMACFPAGTLSGAPKVRAMQIINELEPVRRGVYGGVIGYFDFAGNSDVAIAIRTALIKDGVAYVQAGAGIVADSIAANEEAETRNKAASVLTAIERAAGGQA